MRAFRCNAGFRVKSKMFFHSVQIVWFVSPMAAEETGRHDFVGADVEIIEIVSRLVHHGRRVGDVSCGPKDARLVVVLFLFLVLIVGRACSSVAAASSAPCCKRRWPASEDKHRKGAIVFTMPDGAFCRQMAYDNKTAELTESAVAQCAGGATAWMRRAPPSGFAWGHALTSSSPRGLRFSHQWLRASFRIRETFRKIGFQFSDHALG